MPKHHNPKDEDSATRIIKKKTIKSIVPIENDPLVLLKFQLKCDRPLPRVPPHTPGEGDDMCVKWLGAQASHTLQHKVDRTKFNKLNGAFIFSWRHKKYSARNMAYALIRRDFSVLHSSKTHHVRLSSDCGHPYCINPWHHRILPQTLAKRKEVLAQVTSEPEPMDVDVNDDACDMFSYHATHHQ
jgi:hypothetical protein